MSQIEVGNRNCFGSGPYELTSPYYFILKPNLYLTATSRGAVCNISKFEFIIFFSFSTLFPFSNPPTTGQDQNGTETTHRSHGSRDRVPYIQPSNRKRMGTLQRERQTFKERPQC